MSRTGPISLECELEAFEWVTRQKYTKQMWENVRKCIKPIIKFSTGLQVQLFGAYCSRIPRKLNLRQAEAKSCVLNYKCFLV